MDLKECRAEIDKINNEMLKLFIRRMNASRLVAEYKAEHGLPILNHAREREILGEMTEKAGAEFENYVKTFYSVLMDLSRSYQSTVLGRNTEISEKVKAALSASPKVFPSRAAVACQGTEGAYSQIAADKLFGMQRIQYFKTFEDVFVAVRDNVCEYGILPIENSTYGTVIDVYDLMKKYKFNIVRALKLPIKHSLLVADGVKLEDIREVYSHPQAIGQCSEFFRANPNIKPVECANTAVAAKLIKESGRNDVAAIASSSCAELYGLTRLIDGVQNASYNFTRFICISNHNYIFPGSNKISIMLTLPHTPGALYNTLAKFTAEGLNLTKLESRPIVGSDFEAQFYFDFEGAPYDDRVLNMLDALSGECESFEFLGSYLEL
ncbi:MAG: bifunctional chorismate mutase/prephenate dehydratase [Clostridia bacterium]|nr:bifunctional chorismate mutase/prephenate dehydratase [Clostridia bacterium]